MYSGLLPPGMNESDVELSSDDEIQVDAAGDRDIFSKKSVQQTAFEEKLDIYLDTKSSSISDTTTINTDEMEQSDALSEECPRGVSLQIWTKFKKLQNKRSEMKTSVQLGRRRRKRKRNKKAGGNQACAILEDEVQNESKQHSEREAHWNELKQYFGVNDRLEHPACSRPLPMTSLEKNIDKAVAKGDLVQAEALSDRLATRELGVKIAQAANSRDFVKARQEVEASRNALKRKKQVAWGFEAKKRWETKSNMGYM
ncbi:protein FAM204A isoform X1 [Acipenser oxyrinchus oxyrinchus]|uniref:Protein FAM204A isoform X1 n=1 Tax=Acipenser oxyrinchus oxyrinchus TaxID=40147 RepID=A0AAD8G4G0_ACIOX|nr:protein FAM204A isoform X1 [Acipenser oxyrinchus oxyrinchus]